MRKVIQILKAGTKKIPVVHLGGGCGGIQRGLSVVQLRVSDVGLQVGFLAQGLRAVGLVLQGRGRDGAVRPLGSECKQLGKSKRKFSSRSFKELM